MRTSGYNGPHDHQGRREQVPVRVQEGHVYIRVEGNKCLSVYKRALHTSGYDEPHGHQARMEEMPVRVK